MFDLCVPRGYRCGVEETESHRCVHLGVVARGPEKTTRVLISVKAALNIHMFFHSCVHLSVGVCVENVFSGPVQTGRGTPCNRCKQIMGYTVVASNIKGFA